MESLCHFRTTTRATRQLNAQSLKFVHCHTEDFDDEMHKKEGKAERRRGGSKSFQCQVLIVMSNSGSSTDYLCVNDPSEV